MHAMTCQCSKCRRGGSAEFELFEFDDSPQGEFDFESDAGTEYEDSYEFEEENEFEAEYADAESPFTEAEENELAMELLSVSSEDELDQFLGKIFKKVGRGLKKIGRPLGRALKGVAKKALPFVGGALGSLIPIPGVGTAVGSALGSAVAKALEAELGELDEADQELEMARRFVRIAGTAAKHADSAGASADPKDAARGAVQRAARKHLPMIGIATRGGGRWFRRGDRIVVVGA